MEDKSQTLTALSSSPSEGRGMSLTQDDILILLVEECGEVIQAATKCLRFGFDVDHGTGYGNNRLALSREIGDLLGAADGLDLDKDNINAMRATKLLRARVAKDKYAAPTYPAPAAPEREAEIEVDAQIAAVAAYTATEDADITSLLSRLGLSEENSGQAAREIVRSFRQQMIIAGAMASTLPFRAAQQNEPVAWRCFHCDEVFTDPKVAASHFGVDHRGNETLCQLAQVDGGIAKVIANLADELQRYRSEDNTSFREFYALGGDHRAALIREEQKGYDRGLADGRAEQGEGK